MKFSRVPTGYSVHTRRRLAALGAAAVLAVWVPTVPAATAPARITAPIERLRGVYLQRAIELATVGTRLVRLTRMTRFSRCGLPHPLAEELNGHIVEVIGRDVRAIGFVAGVVNVTEGCQTVQAEARHGIAGPQR